MIGTLFLLAVSGFIWASGIAAIKCPSESILKVEGGKSVRRGCCLKTTAETSCIGHGPYEYLGTTSGTVFFRTEYSHGKKNGLFQEWYADGKTQRISGQYKDEKPDGRWAFYGAGGTEEIGVRYENGKLVEIKIFDRVIKDIHPPAQLKSPRAVGFDLPQPESGLDRITYQPAPLPAGKLKEHLFYADDKGEKVSGIAVGNYRFLHTEVRDSSHEEFYNDTPSNPKWVVWKKIDKTNKCLSHIKFMGIGREETVEAYWYTCHQYTDIFESLKGKVDFFENTHIFKEPGGTKRLDTKKFSDEDFTGTYLGKRLIKGEWWLKLEFEYDQDCPHGSCKYSSVIGWTPLYNGNQLVPSLGIGPPNTNTFEFKVE